jgi:fatty-acyl-CoA synthase
VIGVPDDRYGEELMAWIRLREGASLTEDDVRSYCEGKIAHFTRPRYVRFADEFPMTSPARCRSTRCASRRSRSSD